MTFVCAKLNADQIRFLISLLCKASTSAVFYRSLSRRDMLGTRTFSRESIARRNNPAIGKSSAGTQLIQAARDIAARVFSFLFFFLQRSLYELSEIAPSRLESDIFRYARKRKFPLSRLNVRKRGVQIEKKKRLAIKRTVTALKPIPYPTSDYTPGSLASDSLSRFRAIYLIVVLWRM